MSTNLLLIYDGECPFCRYFSHIQELKKQFPMLNILNARDKENLTIFKQFSLNHNINNGAILIVDEKILQGSEAIIWFATNLVPYSYLSKVFCLFMSQKIISHSVYPLFILARRLFLRLRLISVEFVIK